MKRAWRILLLLSLCLPLLAMAELEWREAARTETVQPGQTGAKASFHFTNAGKQAIEIERVRTTCGCTTTELAKTTYAPGESGTIDATQEVGEGFGVTVSKKLYVFYHPVGKPEERSSDTLTFTAVVPEYVRQSSRSLVWSLDEGPVTKEIVFSIVHDNPIRLLRAELSRPGFDVELEAVEEGQRYRLLVTPQKPFGESAHSSIDIISDFPEATPITFRAFVRVQPDYARTVAWHTWRDRLLRLLF